MGNSVDLNTLKKIIVEEINHEAIRDVVTSASKLLAALATFKTTATPAVTNALTPMLAKFEQTLENMINNPGSYIAKQSTKKVIKFKQDK